MYGINIKNKCNHLKEVNGGSKSECFEILNQEKSFRSKKTEMLKHNMNTIFKISK